AKAPLIDGRTASTKRLSIQPRQYSRCLSTSDRHRRTAAEYDLLAVGNKRVVIRRWPSFSRPIFDRADIGTRSGDGHLLALRDLPQRLVDEIPGALQVLEPRRGLVVDAALVDERSFVVDHVHMRGSAGTVRVPDFACGIEQYRGG